MSIQLSTQQKKLVSIIDRGVDSGFILPTAAQLMKSKVIGMPVSETQISQKQNNLNSNEIAKEINGLITRLASSIDGFKLNEVMDRLKNPDSFSYPDRLTSLEVSIKLTFTPFQETLAEKLFQYAVSSIQRSSAIDLSVISEIFNLFELTPRSFPTFRKANFAIGMIYEITDSISSNNTGISVSTNCLNSYFRGIYPSYYSTQRRDFIKFFVDNFESIHVIFEEFVFSESSYINSIKISPLMLETIIRLSLKLMELDYIDNRLKIPTLLIDTTFETEKQNASKMLEYALKLSEKYPTFSTSES